MPSRCVIHSQAKGVGNDSTIGYHLIKKVLARRKVDDDDEAARLGRKGLKSVERVDCDSVGVALLIPVPVRLCIWQITPCTLWTIRKDAEADIRAAVVQVRVECLVRTVFLL